MNNLALDVVIIDPRVRNGDVAANRLFGEEIYFKRYCCEETFLSAPLAVELSKFLDVLNA
jgi:hypothetical protein